MNAREGRTMNHTASKAAKRRTGTADARKDAQRDKCTLLLDPQTSIKLSVAAALKGVDRSDLVNDVLADALRHIVISVRGQSPISASHADGVSQVEATAA
jgi:hypothetical protein